MNNYICNAPVLLIFFNRADTFAKVFDKVREVKPRILYLAQDGPRNENDIAGIRECRKIVENIDWECEITRDFSDVNLGCGMRPQSAITKTLKKYGKAIILEDDCVPSRSFFPYCEELLERYKDDERIAYISGLNHFETWDCGNSDYFFTRAGGISGWATWERAWGRFYDYSVESFSDPYTKKLYGMQIANKNVAKQRFQSVNRAFNAAKNQEKLSYWDTQWGFAQFTQNMLAIVPRKNLICNIGVGTSSTHAQGREKNKYVKFKNMLFIPTYELEFPLKNPAYCAPDMEYHNLVYKMNEVNPLRAFLGKIARRLRVIK